MRFKTLPLGIDLGGARVRVALAEANRAGAMRVLAVVGRDLPDDASTSANVSNPQLVGAVLEEMIAELGTRERRCVGAIGAPRSALRVLKLPKMSWAERVRAARFEAQRFAHWNLDDEPSYVRIHPIDRAEHLYAVAAVTRDVVDSRLCALRSARLRVSALEHDAFALRRAYPQYDAVLDIGAERTALHAFGTPGPLTWTLGSGGADVTRGIARDLAIDEPSAERRKRILGTAGAGMSSRETFALDVRELVERARPRVRVTRLALCGNGARLPGLGHAIESATGTSVEFPVSDLLQGSAYPDDVLRAASPDWTLAAGLAAWGATA